jgi:hypothetical protein
MNMETNTMTELNSVPSIAKSNTQPKQPSIITPSSLSQLFKSSLIPTLKPFSAISSCIDENNNNTSSAYEEASMSASEDGSVDSSTEETIINDSSDAISKAFEGLARAASCKNVLSF